MSAVARALIALTLLLAPMSGALAEEGKGGRPVTIRVVDDQGLAIPNARVKIPGTEGKTLTNRNGEWTESMLYTIEGDEFIFKKNAFLEFHVSAPEFHARSVKYKIRGRMNYVEVALRKMPEPTAPLKAEDDRDLLIRWFQRTETQEAPAETVTDQDGVTPASGSGG
jgi:hypothetical protein